MKAEDLRAAVRKAEAAASAEATTTGEEETVPRGTARTQGAQTVRATIGETVPRETVRMEEAGIVRIITGIITARTVQTITVQTARRATVRMEERAAITAAGAQTVRREDVRITAADRAEETRWDVR